MKDILFSSDLLTLFRHDKHYGRAQNLSVALPKIGVTGVEKTADYEHMLHAFVVSIIDQRGQSEPFLAGAFIAPEAVTQLLKDQGLPAPAALQPTGTTDKDHSKSLDPARLEKCFDIVCRNSGTVTDPLATAYRTPIGRLVFKTFLETRLTLGINTTARYVLEHLKDYDTEAIVTSVTEDGVTWLTEDRKEKITSVQTIATFVLKFNRELKTLL
jgi:hypothetical protein